ncbi:hypothetical protein AVEN_33131-1 [Araneus ventricosus]|uniref:Uncharacterized protein n=1 Tax=Araneus ventricosus TaxID=182803 RepID=A0A4Y2MPU1_ARAVE|nr:hypothetical protein AVEN_33131-1 [Araneus ventricosus]
MHLFHQASWKHNKKEACIERIRSDHVHPGLLTYGRLLERRLPFLNKAPKERLKVSALNGLKNELYLEVSMYPVFDVGKYRCKCNSFKIRFGLEIVETTYLHGS